MKPLIIAASPFMWALMILIRVIVWIIGLIAVPLAINFIHKEKNDRGQYIERLPKWAILWDNVFDGTGSHLDWWAELNRGNAYTFKARFKWLQLRNPTNWLTRNFYGVDQTGRVIDVIGRKDVGDRVGREGWQFVSTGWYTGFYMCYLYPGRYDRKGIRIRLGYKLSSENKTGRKALRGWSFTIAPWKTFHSK